MTNKKLPPELLKPPLPTPAVSEFVEQDVSEEQKGDINYDTLIHIAPVTRDFPPEEEAMAQKIVFYCRDCQKIAKTIKKEKANLKFQCQDCGGDHIYYGSELGIRNYFHLTK